MIESMRKLKEMEAEFEFSEMGGYYDGGDGGGDGGGGGGGGGAVGDFKCHTMLLFGSRCRLYSIETRGGF